MGKKRNSESYGLNSDGAVLSLEYLAEDGTWRKVDPAPIPGPVRFGPLSQAPGFDCRVLDRTIRLTRDINRWFVDLD